MQKGRGDYVLAGVVAAVVVAICNFTGLSNMSIIIGALAGIIVGSFSRSRFEAAGTVSKSGDA